MSGAAGKRANIEAFIGVSGSGKGVSINRRLAELNPARLLIWDPRDEYGKWAPAYRSPSALLQAMRQAGTGPVRARYVFGDEGAGSSDDDQIADAFAFVCNLAFRGGDLVFLAEELSDVTRPSWAPASWKRCITQGRHQSLHIIGAAQRPALVDKTFLGNATRVRCLALNYRNDRQTMAAELDTTIERVQAITATDGDGWADLQFLQIDRRTRERVAGMLRIRGNRITETAGPM